MSPRWDIVIIGAGPAGVLATERLRARGLRVLLLDAGPRLGATDRVPEVDRHVWGFSTRSLSYDWYRVRAVGGRTLLWGGWSFRFPEHVFRRAGWPYGERTLAPYYRTLERRLGVGSGALDERYRQLGRALDLRVVPKRGALEGGTAVWNAARGALARTARTWSVATRFEHSGGRATALAVTDLRTGRSRTIRARGYVLAASPIETARILLQSELGSRARAVGRGLVDHMVASYVLIEPAAPPSVEGRGPFPGSALVESFVNTNKRTARDYPGGFSVELSGPVSLETLGIERMVPGDQIANSRATLIHALGEVFPHPKRRVDLDPEKRDAIGRPFPRIHGHWSRADRAMARDMKSACEAIADRLAVPNSRLVPFVDPLLPGAGHEAGTCAMGLDESSPCDRFGRFRGLENVWIADASAMPTSGDRHPTLTLLAHALRVADAATASVSRH